MSEVLIANTVRDFHEFLTPERTIVDFFGTWCGPCKMVSPHLDRLAEEGQRVIKVDIDVVPELVAEYEVMSVPTLLVFENGKVIGDRVGFATAEKIKEWMATL